MDNITEIDWPSEVPCAGCGWPQYCCLCGSCDDDLELDKDQGDKTVEYPVPNEAVA